MSGINAALSGLVAAQTRMATSASNVANQHSTVEREGEALFNRPYEAREVQQTSQEPSGTSAEVLLKTRPTAPIYDPDAAVADEEGIVQTPNVNPDEEVVQQILAEKAFKANLKTIQVEDENLGKLLDVNE